MAAPFGGYPTLGKYLAWASSVGCECQSGYLNTDTMHRIKAPNGKSVVIARADQREILNPSYVGYLDRRLGLDSPFAKSQSGYD